MDCQQTYASMKTQSCTSQGIGRQGIGSFCKEFLYISTIPCRPMPLCTSEKQLFGKANDSNPVYVITPLALRLGGQRGQAHHTFQPVSSTCTGLGWAGLGWGANTANLRTKILDFRGFDSSIILISMGGIPRPIGIFPEI